MHLFESPFSSLQPIVTNPSIGQSLERNIYILILPSTSASCNDNQTSMPFLFSKGRGSSPHHNISFTPSHGIQTFFFSLLRCIRFWLTFSFLPPSLGVPRFGTPLFALLRLFFSLSWQPPSPIYLGAVFHPLTTNHGVRFLAGWFPASHNSSTRAENQVAQHVTYPQLQACLRN